MRVNLPVTPRQIVLSPEDVLVSTTDLDSRITYCNPAFVRVSGYRADELLGQPHNLVRHPDMPSEAFRDLWATVRSGRTWRACVKNRTKGGDAYWVVAQVTPLIHGGRVTGYMSVRTAPTPEQIREAEALYATMREQAATGRQRLRLNAGELQAAGWRGRLAERLRPGLAAGLRLAVLAPVGLLTAAGLPLLLGSTGMAGLGWLAGALGAAWLLALVLGELLVRSVRGPLDEAIRQATALAGCDLAQTGTATSRGEMGRLLQAIAQLQVNLRGLVSDVRQEVVAVDRASDEIAGGASDLSRRTESQSASLQQTAASIEQLDGTVRHNADNASSASRLAREAAEVAGQGSRTMVDVQSTMQGILASSKRIGDIVQVIDGIAFQTNILALNAAVESARAGEHGRGFAVVAGEVRALAQRSSLAAREIKSLIDASGEQVANGARTVEGAGEAIQGIVASVERVAQLIVEIDTATGQQSLGISQVNQAVSELDGHTQQNAALVEQSAAAADLLRRQAHQLAQCVRIFHLPGAAVASDARPVREPSTMGS